MHAIFSYTTDQWLLFFFIYCFFGWIFESTYVSLCKHRFVNRGFMRGPFLPLYGSGAILMLFVSIPVENHLALVYLAGCIAATALEYVNKVKRRAYGYSPDGASPVDYGSLTDRTLTADATDHLANDPLLYELWAEFFGEMRWWEDVRFLRLGKQEADYYKTVSGPGAAKTNIVWKDTNYAMPIPTSEFESNPNPDMVQTPGY